MGRIKGKQVRDSTLEILKVHKNKFEKNKEVLKQTIVASKVMRNKIAGFITKLAKNKQIESYIIEHAGK